MRVAAPVQAPPGWLQRAPGRPAGLGTGPWLGGLVTAAGSTMPDAPGAGLWASLPARALSPTAEVTDAWRAARVDPARGVHGPLRWCDDGHWLWAVAEVDEASGLHDAARDAYAAVFELMAARGAAHLQRVWNYLPRLHEDEAGLERYRAFNAGRQQAFLQAGAAAFEGAPAACALGLPDGPLVLRLLAGRRPAVAIENPRQVSAYHYPADYGPRAPTFSRAALSRAADGTPLLFVSGTASIVGHASRHAGDLAAQTEETLMNLRTVVDEASRCSGRRYALPQLALTAYVRHAADAAPVRAQLSAALGADSPALRTLVIVQADVCRRELLVEIEAHGEPGTEGLA